MGIVPPPPRFPRAAAALIALAAWMPSALGELTGSGQLSDVVSLTVTTGTLGASALASSAGAPVSSPDAFTVGNGNSNVVTFIRYDWATVPYYGASSSQTSISLRGTTHHVKNMLWFRQSVTDPATTTTTTSDFFSPLILKDDATISTATFASSGNACTAWSGSPAGGFAPTAAGTVTFKYHPAAGPVDDSPSTSNTHYYCLDVTNLDVYLGTSQNFGTATLVRAYSEDSSLQALKSYLYEFKPTGTTKGNGYCMTDKTGSGTSAKPVLHQCEKMNFHADASATARMYPLFDPPPYFPSVNQLGTSNLITFALSGTQWNPWSHTTTQSA